MNRKRARQNYAATTAASSYEEPDVYGHKRRAVRQIIQQLNDSEEYAFDHEPQLPLISDTSAAAQYLIAQVPQEKLPPMCFVHQIYSLLSNNTAVDREIQQEVKSGEWRQFHIIGTLEDCVAIMRTTDYLSVVEGTTCENSENTHSNCLERFKDLILDQRYIDPAISSSCMHEFGFTEDDIRQLTKCGLLLPHTNLEAYWFAVRRQGTYMSSYLSGRTELLRTLKKRPTKDMLEKQLKDKKLRKTLFSHEFLLHDLVGSGCVERHRTTMGDLIKLTKKGEKAL